MKTKILFGILAMVAASVIAADSSTKDDVTPAVKKLAQKENHSWKSTMDFGSFASTSEGKTDKEGLIALSIASGEKYPGGISQGGKGALKTAEQDWQR